MGGQSYEIIFTDYIAGSVSITISTCITRGTSILSSFWQEARQHTAAIKGRSFRQFIDPYCFFIKNVNTLLNPIPA
jgi:hypothetical protein